MCSAQNENIVISVGARARGITGINWLLSSSLFLSASRRNESQPRSLPAVSFSRRGTRSARNIYTRGIARLNEQLHARKAEIGTFHPSDSLQSEEIFSFFASRCNGRRWVLTARFFSFSFFFKEDSSNLRVTLEGFRDCCYHYIITLTTFKHLYA